MADYDAVARPGEAPRRRRSTYAPAAPPIDSLPTEGPPNPPWAEISLVLPSEEIGSALSKDTAEQQTRLSYDETHHGHRARIFPRALPRSVLPSLVAGEADRGISAPKPYRLTRSVTRSTTPAMTIATGMIVAISTVSVYPNPDVDSHSDPEKGSWQTQA